MNKTTNTTVAALGWLAIGLAAVVAVTPTITSAEVGGTITRSASSTTETVTVGPALVDCVGVGPQQCMVVDGNNFYDTIEGFTFEPGYNYVLEITKTERANPPADASAYEYSLVEVVSKTRVANNDLVDVSDVVLERLQKQVDTIIATYLQIGEWKIEGGGTATFADGRIGATVGCNSMGADYTLSGDSIEFGAMVTTLMFCVDEDVMEREQNFATTLATVTDFTLTNTGVTLSGEDGSIVLSR